MSDHRQESKMPTNSPGSPAPKVDLGTALDDATDKMDEECPHFTWTRRECDRCQRAILLTFADRVRGEREERLRDFVDELAAEDCHYGDNCPPFGTRHGACLRCRSKEALAEGGDGE